MAKVLVLDVIGGRGLYEADCSELEDFYRELKCDTFDIAVRKIGGKYFDLFVDDEGLFVDNPIPSVLDTEMKPMLVGNVVFANHDEHGETTSLSDDDIEKICNSAFHVIATKEVTDSGFLSEWIAIYPAEY